MTIQGASELSDLLIQALEQVQYRQLDRMEFTATEPRLGTYLVKVYRCGTIVRMDLKQQEKDPKQHLVFRRIISGFEGRT